MKRLGLIMMSVALMLGMAQCKKNVETVSEGIGNQNFEDGIIRLKVNDGGKLAVFPHTGGVYYTEGDVIHVASGGAYKGTLTFHDGYFTDFDGTAPNDGATMYFYYFGGKTPTESTGATSLTVNISDQTTGYPVISYGASNETYSEANAEYTATLNNVGALVKFDVTSSSTTSATCITGMKNKVVFGTLDGSAPTCSVDGTGVISLPAGSGERWAVLLPQDAVSEGILGSAYTPDGHYYGSRGAVPAIKSNDYLSNGITVSLSPTEIGVLPGQFTVNGDGTRVRFSKGNLQYLGTGDSGNLTPQWRFADNQYDYMGDGSNGNVTIEGYSLYNTGSGSATPTDEDKQAARDLFGWGTSGVGAYPPYLTVADNSYYPYAGVYPASIAGTEYDWGMNYISNGSSAKTWRTLTRNEWGYLLNTRTGDKAATVNSTSNVRWCMATINTDGTGVNGLIIFPDGATVASGAATTWGSLNTTTEYATKFTSSQWIALENLGCVFLPSAGVRQATQTLEAGTRAQYRTTEIKDLEHAWLLQFGTGSSNYALSVSAYYRRHNGVSVRLVCQ